MIPVADALIYVVFCIVHACFAGIVALPYADIPLMPLCPENP